MRLDVSNFKLNKNLALIKTNKQVKLRNEDISDTGIIMTVQSSIIDDRPTFGELIQINSKDSELSNIKDKVIVSFPNHVGQDIEGSDGYWYIIIDVDQIIGYRLEKVN